ncbi:hypothetical protein [Fusobacterium ulcerans]|jgi:uncharacterized protein YcfL|nr:hypothetical protein [Fusobacterium ulcerans]MCB8566306.1 hypothetical protein [Fusobacterium ulcerans]MCB8650391.1 hypothetical protein [Fusobacterium ulcerans]
MKKVILGIILLSLLVGCGKKEEVKKLADPKNKIEQERESANVERW